MAVVADRISFAHVSVYNGSFQDGVLYTAVERIHWITSTGAISCANICTDHDWFARREATPHMNQSAIWNPFLYSLYNCWYFLPNYVTYLLILIRINIDYSLPIHDFPLWELHFLLYYGMSLYTRILFHFAHFHSYHSTELALATSHCHLNLSVCVSL
jgi:hypothetical protein